MRYVLMAVVLLASGGVPAMAKTLYVNNLSGNDRYSGRAEVLNGQGLGPLRTIRRALHLATMSDKIVLADTGEPYRESITFFGSKNSGLDGFPFILEGNGATLEGAEPVPQHAWEPYSDYVLRFRPEGLVYQQLFRDHRPLTRRRVTNPALGLPKLKPLEWAMHGGHVYLRVEDAKIPRDYALSYAARRTGITLVSVQHVIIKDLTVQGFQIDGVNYHTSARDCILLGVTCRGNGRSGVIVGAASKVAINQCVIGSNGEAQIRTLPGSYTRVFDTDLFETSAPKWLHRGGRIIFNNEVIAPK